MPAEPKTMQDLGYQYCPICGTRLPHDRHTRFHEMGGVVIAHLGHVYGSPARYDPQTGDKTDA